MTVITNMIIITTTLYPAVPECQAGDKCYTFGTPCASYRNPRRQTSLVLSSRQGHGGPWAHRLQEARAHGQLQGRYECECVCKRACPWTFPQGPGCE